MDAKGWIPVSLIASFNRVRRLTMDVHLVRDVLLLSSMVEVRGDWVRMNGWEQFVLPNASASEVETLDYERPETYVQSFQEEGGGHVQPHSDLHTHGEVHTYGEPLLHGEANYVLPAGVANVEGEENVEDEYEDEEDEEEEEEEEDVVFVMSHDDEGHPWPPERFNPS
jgi:la-related protein 1